MRGKVKLNEIFCIKTRYILNNNGPPIATLELWRKTKQWRKKWKISFCAQRLQRLLSSHKISEKYNE